MLTIYTTVLYLQVVRAIDTIMYLFTLLRPYMLQPVYMGQCNSILFFHEKKILCENYNVYFGIVSRSSLDRLAREIYYKYRYVLNNYAISNHYYVT